MSIVLIGFMGVGKSEVGKAAAERLGYSFLDTDELIEKSEDKEISRIFKENGEEYFRGLETEVLETLQNYDDFVLSTGGGIVLKEKNIGLLKGMGPLVLLTARPEVIFERIKSVNNRPLLETGNKEDKIKEILSVRDPIYNKAADLTIDTSDKKIEEIVEEIVSYAQNKS